MPDPTTTRGDVDDLAGLDPDVRRAYFALPHRHRAGLAARVPAAEAALFAELRRIRSGQPNRAARRSLTHRKGPSA